MTSRRAFAARFAGIVLVAGAFSGCTAIEEKKRSNQLTSRIKSYTKAIRWGDYDLATRYLRHRDGKPATTDTSRIEGVKVTHYNYEIAAPGPEAVEATMTARFDYYLPDSATIRKLKQVGVWWYDTTAQNWYLDDGLPEF